MHWPEPDTGIPVALGIPPPTPRLPYLLLGEASKGDREEQQSADLGTKGLGSSPGPAGRLWDLGQVL